MEHFSTDLLTVAIVAKRLAVTEQTVRRWIREGRLRATRLPGRVRIAPADLQAFLDQSAA